MEPFATLQDLKARWVDMPPGTDQYATTLLSDATGYILDLVPPAIDASPSTQRRVACAMVRRVIEAEAHPTGVDSLQETTGPFSVSFKPSDTALYLRRDEKRALGQQPRAFGVQILSCRNTRVQHDPSCATFYGSEDCDCSALRNAS